MQLQELIKTSSVIILVIEDIIIELSTFSL